jgi:hypothetical protein
MELIRKLSKPTAFFLSFYLIMLACPYQSALAAMIDTESFLTAGRNQSSRDYLNSLLDREDIQAALISQGIDPQEAKARIDGLSDTEVNNIVNKLDELPAGGFLGELLIVVALVFIILLFTDIAGYTDIFPFVKK